MPKVVKRIGGDLGAHFVILDTDSTGTAARLVSTAAYIPGRTVDNYDAEDVAQLDLDALEEVENPQRLWAAFTDGTDWLGTRISAWMPEEEARDALASLHENGETWVYLVAKEV